MTLFELFDQMEKRPGTVFVVMCLFGMVVCAGAFVAGVLFVKWVFF